MNAEALQLAGGYPHPEGGALLGAFILRENDILGPGNITHTPAYGNLIALGELTAVQSRNASQQRVAEAVAYREMIARTGWFLTCCGGVPIIGQRMHPDPRDRLALMLAGFGSYACLNDDAKRRTRRRLLRP
jgi:hypothetical protein